ncbi:hypothetical protein C1H76_1717 [Elsinoe australis]|uniref:Myb-like DNA-binding domain-containing protein n=1 Tax=Elsinoe australis TaxID=40998 RepID=A0A4U7BC04_9PEZI|nr:hypothetical protein C1H76_1717 [Elsinoe australis]
MPTGETNTPDENVKLLASVIKYLEGKPDWTLVAADCDIVSGPAAQKRYSRLLKSLDVTPAKPATKAASKKTTKGKNAVKNPGTGSSGDDSPTGAAEEAQPQKRKAAAATTAKGGKKAKKVKQEQVDKEDEAGASDGVDDAAGAEQEGQVGVEDGSEVKVEVEAGEV